MKDFLKLLTLGGLLGGKSPLAEKWAFLSRRLIYRVGGKIKEK
jgi:hypothetical protein